MTERDENNSKRKQEGNNPHRYHERDEKVGGEQG